MSRWLVTDRKWIPMLSAVANLNYSQYANIIAEIEDGVPIAVILFDDYNHYSMTCHLWIREGKRPSRCFYWAAHDYPFSQAGVEKVFVYPSSRNARVLKMLKHGWKFVTKIPDFYAEGNDALVYSITQDDAEFLNRFSKEPRYVGVQ